MLKFKDLTKSQKTFIVRTLEKFPEYYSEKTLGAKQIHAAYYAMKDERASSGEKLGYPNWLQSNNRVDRGTYQMPWPTEAELKAQSTATVTKVDKDASKLQKIIDESDDFEVEYEQSDEDFMKELRDNGIAV
jgi:hypothetical protein